jgi:hypothetical protein
VFQLFSMLSSRSGQSFVIEHVSQSRCSAIVLLVTRLSPLIHATFRRVIILLKSPWPPTLFAPGRRLARGCQATGSASLRRRTQVRQPVLGLGQEVLQRDPPDPLLLPQGDEHAAHDGGAERLSVEPICASTNASSVAWRWTRTAWIRSQQQVGLTTR